jgi:hypothetical protein
MRRQVLVTGAAGYIAGQLLPAFRERYDLVLLDVKATARDGTPVPGVTLVNLAEPELDQYRHHFRGVNTVVHLGYVHPPDRSMTQYRGATYHEERQNVDLAYTVYQLAHDEGVRRVVVASSNHATDWYEPLIHAGSLDPIGPDVIPYSDNYYGWAKVAYEALGFLFATGRGGRRQLEVVQLRLGAPREIVGEQFIGRPEAYSRDLGAYISRRDLQQLFCRAIETTNLDNDYGVPFQIFYGISNNARKFWGIANARRVLGYVPEDDSEVKFAADIARYLTGDQHSTSGVRSA